MVRRTFPASKLRDIRWLCESFELFRLLVTDGVSDPASIK